MDILLQLEPSKDALAELHERKYKMDLFCGLFSHGHPQLGFSINPSVLKRLGDLNIALGICFY